MINLYSSQTAKTTKDTASNIKSSKYGTVVKLKSLLSAGTSINIICKSVEPKKKKKKNQFELKRVLKMVEVL